MPRGKRYSVTRVHDLLFSVPGPGDGFESDNDQFDGIDGDISDDGSVGTDIDSSSVNENASDVDSDSEGETIGARPTGIIAMIYII